MQVLIYGAGKNALKIWGNLMNATTEMKKIFESSVAFIDKDTKKIGTKFLGLPVMGIKEAINSYPNSYVYISLCYSTELYSVIREDLIRAGLMSGKIINYRKTCDYLEHFLVCGYHEAAFGGKVGCDIGDHSFKPCCSDYGKNQVDYVPILNNDVSFAFDRYLIKRDDLLQKLHNDEMCCCTGCPFVYFSNQPVDNKFFYIIFNEIGRCNCKCVYCNYQVRLGRNVSSDVDIIELYDLIKEKGYLCKESTIELCNGEITIFPEKKRIYDHLKDCHIMFLTNGIIYDEEIARRMQQGTATLNVSIDAGTKETFLAVKGVDAFECVVNNLKLYSKNRKGNFNLKYILLPGINDNCEDIDGFVELCRKLNVSAAHISYNLCLDFEDYNNEKMISAITRLIRKLDEYKIEYEIYSEELKKILKI